MDEDLQEDVEQECNKYGKVDHIVIYQVGIRDMWRNAHLIFRSGEARRVRRCRGVGENFCGVQGEHQRQEGQERPWRKVLCWQDDLCDHLWSSAFRPARLLILELLLLRLISIDSSIVLSSYPMGGSETNLKVCLFPFCLSIVWAIYSWTGNDY